MGFAEGGVVDEVAGEAAGGIGLGFTHALRAPCWHSNTVLYIRCEHIQQYRVDKKYDVARRYRAGESMACIGTLKSKNLTPNAEFLPNRGGSKPERDLGNPRVSMNMNLERPVWRPRYQNSDEGTENTYLHTWISLITWYPFRSYTEGSFWRDVAS